MRIHKKKNTAGEQNPKVDTSLIGELSETQTRPQRVAEINWFSSQSEEVKLEIMAKQASLLQQKRTPGQPITPELSYSMLVLAAKIVHREFTALSEKRKVTEVEGSEIDRKRITAFVEHKSRKEARKRSQIRLQYMGIIKVLREEKGFSWSDIAAYLQQYHAFIVTRAYIQQNYDAIRKEQKEADHE